MRVQHFEIIFDDAETNPDAVYKPGQVVSFKLHVCTSEAVDCKDVKVKIYGCSAVQWKVGKTTHLSREDYVEEEITPFSAPSEGPQAELYPAGDFYYPHSFQLPPNCPASITEEFGSIEYIIKAKMVRVSNVDSKDKKTLLVVRDLDLNSVPSHLAGPNQPDQWEAMTPRWHLGFNACLAKGQATVSLSKRALAIGEQIGVTGWIRNTGLTDFDKVALEIARLTEFKAGGRSRFRWSTASAARLPSIASGHSLKVEHMLPVAPTPCSYLQGCSNMTVNYYFRVVAVGTLAIVKSNFCELIIGSVPIGQAQPVDIAAWSPPKKDGAGAG